MDQTKMTLVWDLPIRVFHWLMVVLFALAWLTSENDTLLPIHVLAGSAMVGLLIFRLIWGWIGSHHARFAHFSYPFAEVIRYLIGLLQNNATRYLGHNPPGSWAIFLMLALLVVILVSGLLTLGGEERQGIFAGWISRSLAEWTAELHEGAVALMLFLVTIHVVGVAVESFFHHENLLMAMLHGKKPLAAAPVNVLPPVTPHSWGVPVVLIMGMIGPWCWLWPYYSTANTEMATFFSTPALPTDPIWTQECRDCHLDYHPSLLPSRSWESMIKDNHHHFGEDLALNQKTIDHLLQFAQENSAEHQQSQAAYKIEKSLKKSGDSPWRITETPYWKRKHRKIADSVWQNSKVGGKLRCENCHQDAKLGTFVMGAMRIP